MKLQGKIKRIGQTNTFGDNGFRKRNLVITTDDQYPQVVLIEFMQDKCALLDNYKEGQDVDVSINVNGREWVNPEGVTKYFNTINGWKIYGVNDNNSSNNQPSQKPESQPQNNTVDASDDLPF